MPGAEDDFVIKDNLGILIDNSEEAFEADPARKRATALLQNGLKSDNATRGSLYVSHDQGLLLFLFLDICQTYLFRCYRIYPIVSILYGNVFPLYHENML
jgi:hypothetical protein